MTTTLSDPGNLTSSSASVAPPPHLCIDWQAFDAGPKWSGFLFLFCEHLGLVLSDDTVSVSWLSWSCPIVQSLRCVIFTKQRVVACETPFCWPTPCTCDGIESGQNRLVSVILKLHLFQGLSVFCHSLHSEPMCPRRRNEQSTRLPSGRSLFG